MGKVWQRKMRRAWPRLSVAVCGVLMLAGMAISLITGFGYTEAFGDHVDGLKDATHVQRGMSAYHVSAMVNQLELPHVDKCNYCQICHITSENIMEGNQRAGRRMMMQQAPNIIIRPLQIEPIDKTGLPNCTECHGCTHELRYLEKSVFLFNSTYTFDTGKTSAQIFQVEGPTVPKTDKPSIVKLWCVQVWNEGKGKIPTCKPYRATEAIPIMVSVQKIADECGFTDIIANTWIEPVNGIIPGAGFHVKWDGLWSEKASGISLDQLVFEGEPGFPTAALVDFLVNKVNKTEIVLAAIFDLLISQGDRHEQNLFFDESGHLTLIDNDEAFNHTWRELAFDSLFLPTTQNHMSHHVGMDYLRKEPDEEPTENPDPIVLLDYRCHAPGGKIGFNYPPSVETCLKRISGMTHEAVLAKYSLQQMRDAKMLHQRATDLLTKGFEWTLEFGEPNNPSPLRYAWGAPCCKMTVGKSGNMTECSDPGYHRDFHRPEGDPKYGDLVFKNASSLSSQ